MKELGMQCPRQRWDKSKDPESRMNSGVFKEEKEDSVARHGVECEEYKGARSYKACRSRQGVGLYSKGRQKA